MKYFYLVPAASIVALVFAYYFFKRMMKESEGTEKMKTIAQYVRDGAMSYLKQQYKVVTIVFIIIACFSRDGLFWASKQLGAVCLPVGWFLLGLGRFLRHEDGHVCLREDG